MEKLGNKLYSYMFAKQVVPNVSNYSTLTEFKQLFAIGSDEVCPTTIHYTELVDEHLDLTETIRHVVLHSFDTPKQKGYVVLTGDSKTYEHSNEVKRL